MSNKESGKRKSEKKPESYAFRIKLGEYEVEIKGTYEEVTSTIENLPNLVTSVHKAFDIAKPKTVATLTVKTEPADKEKGTPKMATQKYPKIKSASNCEDAVFKLLETDWGKWRPRTTEELRDSMKTNKMKYTKLTIEKTLNRLANKGMVRRWNTNAGFVYILAEEKSASSGEEVK